MVVSIHQPNLCPYAGIFEKIRQSDVFIVMAHCQFTKNNFQNRFYYAERWYTMRCNQSHEPIRNKKYLHPKEDWNRITSRLPKLKIFDRCVDENLWVMNYGIIQEACRILGIKTVLVQDYKTELTGTDRLVDLCRAARCDTYLSGTSGTKYLDMEKFKNAGINVIFQSNPDKRALCELL